jgi:sister chromatid cohesion protein DCC1
MLYSVYQQIKPDDTYTYKLLQLPNELLDLIKTNNEPITLKSGSTDDENHLVVCSEHKTWRLRQMNHSNYITLLDNSNNNHNNKIYGSCTEEPFDASNTLVGFANTTYEYELSPFTGVINKSNLPIFDGKFPDDGNYTKTSMEKLLEESPISKYEFYHNWYANGGCDVEDIAVILSDSWITEVLTMIITVLIAQGLDYNLCWFDLKSTFQLVHNENNDFTESMVTTVIHKFSRVKDGQFMLENESIAQWFGIQTLAQSNLKLWKKQEFLIHWKSSLPEFYNVSLDLKNLYGHYCRPVEDRIRYVDTSKLSSQVSIRFTQLFQAASLWDYNEFLPFITKLVPPGKKVDTMIMKYGRKKKIAKDKFIVVPR